MNLVVSCEAMSPLVLIVGPTGAGKSALGLQLADKFSGAILNCDSLQTYQRLDIGTAKPTVAEMSQVPHFLFDVISPGEVLTAGDFRRMAFEILHRELPRRPLFGVGGSGFYIQALVKGMFDVDKPDPEIESAVRTEAEKIGLEGMFAQLEKMDPVYAGRISRNDSYRVLRALIIIRDSGKTVTELQETFQAREFPFPLLKLGISPTREELLPLIERRTKDMLSSGLLDEVKALLDEGFTTWPALQSVGYKECVAFLNGEIAEEKLEPLIVEKTMQLAKKQRTWFKRDTEIQWLPFANPYSLAQEIVTQFLDRRS